MEPSTASQVSKMTPLTDSPWFWLYVFATVGLGLLVLVGPKWIERQVGLDQRAQGIRHSMEKLSDPEEMDSMRSEVAESRRSIQNRWRRQFQVMVGLLGVGISVAWFIFFSQRRRGRREALSGAMPE